MKGNQAISRARSLPEGVTIRFFEYGEHSKKLYYEKKQQQFDLVLSVVKAPCGVYGSRDDLKMGALDESRALLHKEEDPDPDEVIATMLYRAYASSDLNPRFTEYYFEHLNLRDEQWPLIKKKAKAFRRKEETSRIPQTA